MDKETAMPMIAVQLDLKGVAPLFQADLWTGLGFRVIGSAAIRASAHGAVVPDYDWLYSNIDAWCTASKRASLRGRLVGASGRLRLAGGRLFHAHLPSGGQ